MHTSRDICCQISRQRILITIFINCQQRVGNIICNMEDMRLSILLVKDSAAFVCLFEAPPLN